MACGLGYLKLTLDWCGSLHDMELGVRLDLPGNKSATVPVMITSAQGGRTPTYGAILMHGAGGDMHSGNLPQFAAALATAGLLVVRFTARGPLEYRVKVCRAVLDQLHTHAAECKGVNRWLLCGHSMGGRVACQVAHDLPATALGCVLLSYPLHPPGKFQELRDQPLTQLTHPLLFVRGTRDEFSRQEEWDEVLARLQSGLVEVQTVEGGNHQLAVKGADSGSAVEAACQAVQKFAAMVAQQAQQLEPGPPLHSAAEQTKGAMTQSEGPEVAVNSKKRSRKTGGGQKGRKMKRK